MPVKNQISRKQVSGDLRGTGQNASRRMSRSARSEVEAEIAALNEKIKRELVELQIQADRLLAK